MKRTKSKLDLVKLQEQFDQLLENFTKEDVISWKHHDMELQSEQLILGKLIEVDSISTSYTPVTSNISDIIDNTPNSLDNYGLAA